MIEILIVVAIIVILGSMSIIPVLMGARARGLITGTIVELRTVATAMEIYAIENANYPEDTNESLADFRSKYLDGKEKIWLWDKNDLIVDIDDYSVNGPDRASYTIKKEIPLGLRYPAKVVAGLDFEPSHLRLTSERGIELGNFP